MSRSIRLTMTCEKTKSPLMTSSTDVRRRDGIEMKFKVLNFASRSSCCILRRILFVIMLLVGTDLICAMSDEKRLIKHLLDEYEVIGIVGRPVLNINETMKVHYGLALIQILDLNEKDQILTTNVWCRYIWRDMMLAWDPARFGGVDQVRVPIAKIWSPDIVLYNYADHRLKELREAMAVVSNDGTVLWMPPAIFRSTCSIDITHFPFDVQVCYLKFGSWTYDGFKLDINFHDDQEAMETSDYVESNEWALLEHPAKKNVKYYQCCTEPYPDLTFSVRLKRTAAFYNYILILPCVLLSFLTLVIFWLPPESPAKMMLGMNVFVAFFVLLLLLADNTPPAALSIPLIGAYFCMNMILITLSTFLAIIVINTHIRGDRKNRVPKLLKLIAINGLARILCMGEFLDQVPSKPRYQGCKQQQQHQQQPQKQSSQRSSTYLLHHKRPHQPPPPPDETTSLSTTFRNTKTNVVDIPEIIPDIAGPLIRKRSDQNHKNSKVEFFESTAQSSSTGLATTTMTTTTMTTTTTTRATKRPDCLIFDQLSYHQSNNSAPLEPTISPSEKSSETSMDNCVGDCPAAGGSRDAGPNGGTAASTFMPTPTSTYLQSLEAMEKDIHEIRNILKSYMNRLCDKDSHARVTREWRIVARVFDRLFFFVYCGTIVISLATIFPKG